MIEETLASWIGGLSLPLYPVDTPSGQKTPSIIYKIESEFIPEDDNGPYGAIGHRANISIWNTSYKTAYEVANDVRAALNISRNGFLVTVIDRVDDQDISTNLYSVVLDVEITQLQTVIEPEQNGLRGAARSILLNKTDCGANVFGSRIAFANCNQFPCMNIAIDNIDVENDNDDDKYTAEIELRIKLPSSVNSENQLELITEQIKRVLSGDIQLMSDSLLTIERIDTQYSSIGHLSFDEHRIELSVEYYQSFLDASDLGIFVTADASWNSKSTEGLEAKDTLTLPQE